MINRFRASMAIGLVFFTVHVFPAALKSGEITLSVKEKSILVKKGRRNIIDLEHLLINYTEADNWKIAAVNAKQIRLIANFPPQVEYLKDADDKQTRTAEITISKVPGGFRIYTDPDWGLHTTLHFKYLDDHFFGLSAPLQPDNRRSPDLTDSIITVDIEGRAKNIQENYASAYSHFYISSLGYGAFFDTFARGRYGFGINGKNKTHLDTGRLDWYLFFGDNGAEIHKAYFKVVGQPKKLPAWAVGPVGWRDQNNGGAAEIMADIENMNKLRIPFTAWFVDRPYSDGEQGWSKMNFGKLFANPDKWITKIREEYKLEFMSWSAAATFGDLRFDRHLYGNYSYLDLSHPGTVKAFQNELQSKQYAYGVRGHKIDRADESFPLYAKWYDESVGPDERRNKYVYLSAKTHDEALRQIWADNQVTFARAAIHRVQPYLSAIWGGDPRNSWQGMQSNFANGIRTSFLGFPVWGSDVGGYLGEGRIPEELYIRWLQAGSMSGLFEIKLDGAGGRGRDRVPWHYDDKLQQAFRSACEERMRWLPYLYSLANTSAENGSIMQPLAYKHLNDPKTYSIWNQFYIGNAVLVAPVFKAGTARSVYLPEGNWRELDNPALRYKGNKTYAIEAPLTKLPRFIKDNSLYITGSTYQGNEKLWEKDVAQLHIHATPGKLHSSTSFIYVDMLDADIKKTVSLAREKSGITINSPPLAGQVTMHVALDKKPVKVTLHNKTIDTRYDGDSGVLTVPIGSYEKIDLVISY